VDLTGLTGVIGLAALVIAFIDFLRNATAGKVGLNAVVTQLCAWIAGLVAVFLYAESQLGVGVVLGDTTLDKADTATKIIVGLGIASIASTFVKLTKSIDSSDSNKQPPLLK